jgi:hypothetical protein
MRGCNLYEAFQNPYKKQFQSELLSINRPPQNSLGASQNSLGASQNSLGASQNSLGVSKSLNCNDMINHILSCKECRNKMLYYFKDELSEEHFQQMPQAPKTLQAQAQSKCNKQNEFMINIILGIILIILFA